MYPVDARRCAVHGECELCRMTVRNVFGWGRVAPKARKIFGAKLGAAAESQILKIDLRKKTLAKAPRAPRQMDIFKLRRQMIKIPLWNLQKGEAYMAFGGSPAAAWPLSPGCWGKTLHVFEDSIMESQRILL